MQRVEGGAQALSDARRSGAQVRDGDGPPVVVIAAPRGVTLGLRGIWEYRELAWYLVLRSVKPRYRQTALGLAWALVPPFMLMIVFTVFMNKLVGVQPPKGSSYPIFSYSGLLLWQYFSSAATRGSTALLSNGAFVTKVFFPRALLPLSNVLDALFDLAVAFLIMIPLMIYYHQYPNWQVVILPPALVLAALTALGVSLFVNSLGIQYRDLGLAIPLVIQLGLYATPVVYPITSYPGRWQTLVLIFNPMASAIQAFRWGLVDSGPAPSWEFLAALGIAVALVLGSLLLFNRMERTFSDEL